MKFSRLQWSGIALILIIGLIHLYLIPEEFEEAPHMGYLFGANFLGALIASTGVYRQKIWGWALGFLIGLGSISGYILSRTVGMPGHEIEEWYNPVGILSLSAEVIFLALAFFALARTGQEEQIKKYVVLIPAACLLVTALAGGATVYRMSQVELLTQSALEEEYGVRVSAIGLTMGGGIIDLRLKIINAEKAEELFGHSHSSTIMLIVSDDVELAGANMAHHSTLRDGDVSFIWFANPGHLIQPGMPVTLQFGQIQVGAYTIQ